MGWKEINERNRARLQGQAGVFRVASELLLRGFNPQFPAVDCGADLVVDGGIRLQVKSGHLRYNSNIYPQGAYWFKLTKGPTVHGNHGIRPRTPRVFSVESDFVIFWGIEQHRFWVVPSALLDDKSLIVLGPEIGWAEVNMDEAQELRNQGKTIREIAQHFDVNEKTIARRLEGKYVQPADSRALTYKVRECEGRWDAIRACVDTLTEAQSQVATATEGA